MSVLKKKDLAKTVDYEINNRCYEFRAILTEGAVPVLQFFREEKTKLDGVIVNRRDMGKQDRLFSTVAASHVFTLESGKVLTPDEMFEAVRMLANIVEYEDGIEGDTT